MARDTRSISAEEVAQAIRAVGEYGGQRAAADALGISRASLRRRIEKASGIPQPPPEEFGFEVGHLPSDELPVEDLIARRKLQFAQKRVAKEARKLIDVRVKIDGPFGICHMGDPHVDDDGTDISLIERHTEIIQRTEGLFGANVGDMQNNWVGRLARLWAQQGTSAKQGWMLTEWLVHRVPWLYLIGGNHDCWSGSGDPIQWMMRNQSGVYEPSGARLGLTCPNGRVIRVNARHDFKGHSQWNTAHGPAKAAQMGWRDHILTCGHLHISGYQVVKDPASGLITHAIRAASYKTFDRYAEELGLPDQNIFVAPVTIIDPSFADDDARCVTTIFDPEEGAEYLTWKRSKHSTGKRAA